MAFSQSSASFSFFEFVLADAVLIGALSELIALGKMALADDSPVAVTGATMVVSMDTDLSFRTLFCTRLSFVQSANVFLFHTGRMSAAMLLQMASTVEFPCTNGDGNVLSVGRVKALKIAKTATPEKSVWNH